MLTNLYRHSLASLAFGKQSLSWFLQGNKGSHPAKSHPVGELQESQQWQPVLTTWQHHTTNFSSVTFASALVSNDTQVGAKLKAGTRMPETVDILTLSLWIP